MNYEILSKLKKRVFSICHKSPHPRLWLRLTGIVPRGGEVMMSKGPGM